MQDGSASAVRADGEGHGTREVVDPCDVRRRLPISDLDADALVLPARELEDVVVELLRERQ